MKKTAFWSCLALVVLACGGSPMGEEPRAPKIELKEVRHDFGKVARGTQVSHVFEVRNTGNDPLIIERLEPS